MSISQKLDFLETKSALHFKRDPDHTLQEWMWKSTRQSGVAKIGIYLIVFFKLD